ncbi:MAG: hypothetical protein JSV05_02870 [Candidatus Bathyarchaeota archaeon]|nr:MAG: hypothetical protein JSV05_02870 [Candidatus Bathyarchaeota archaeon]
MKIVKVESFLVSVPFKEEYRGSYLNVHRGIKRAEHVIVRVHTDDGLVGFGETIGGASTIYLIDHLFGPAIIGYDPLDLERILELMDELDGWWRGSSIHCFQKAGIEYALYDLIGKSLKLPVHKLLGGCYREKIPLSWSIGIKPPKATAAEAEKRVAEGYRTVNLKIGSDIDRDIESVRLVRERVGDNVKIRADANQAFSSEVAIKVIKKMSKYELEYVEQPVPAHPISNMIKVVNAVDTPVSADESVISIQDCIEVIENEAADIIAIKPLKHGGLYNAKKVAIIAEAAGIPCMMGGKCELGIGVIASAHLVAASKIIEYDAEITGVLRHRADILEEPLKYQQGCLEVPTEPGFGVNVDDSKLQEFAIFAGTPPQKIWKN